MKKHQIKSSIIVLLFFGISIFQLKAQTTKVKGKVTDESNAPMPFVNINFINSNIGTTTDFDGVYSLETKWATDSLSASFLGYQKDVRKITKNKSQTIHFKLKTSSVKINTVNILEKKKAK